MSRDREGHLVLLKGSVHWEDTPVTACVPEDRPSKYMKPVGLTEVMGEDASNSFPPKKKKKKSETGQNCPNEPKHGTRNQPEMDHKLASTRS